MSRRIEAVTHEVRVVDELEEFDDEGREKLVVARRLVGEGEPDGSDDGGASVTGLVRQASLELRKVLGGVEDGELTKAVRRDVASSLVLRLAVVKEGSPERVRDGGERVGRAVDDDLRWRRRISYRTSRAAKQSAHLLESLKSEVALLVVRLDELEDGREEGIRVADGDVARRECRRAPHVLGRRREVLDDLAERLLVRSEVAVQIGKISGSTRRYRKSSSTHTTRPISPRVSKPRMREAEDDDGDCFERESAAILELHLALLTWMIVSCSLTMPSAT